MFFLRCNHTPQKLSFCLLEACHFQMEKLHVGCGLQSEHFPASHVTFRGGGGMYMNIHYTIYYILWIFIALWNHFHQIVRCPEVGYIGHEVLVADFFCVTTYGKYNGHLPHFWITHLVIPIISNIQIIEVTDLSLFFQLGINMPKWLLDFVWEESSNTGT